MKSLPFFNGKSLWLLLICIIMQLALPISAAEGSGGDRLQFFISPNSSGKGVGELPLVDVVIINRGKTEASVSVAMATVPTFALFDFRTGARTPLRDEAPLITYVNEVIVVPGGGYAFRSINISDLNRFFMGLPEVVRIGLLVDGRNNVDWLKFSQSEPWVLVAETLLRIPRSNQDRHRPE